MVFLITSSTDFCGAPGWTSELDLSRVARLGCVASAAVMLAGASFFEVFFEVFFLAGDFLAGAFFSFLSLPIVVECVCSIRPNSPRS
ncbi:hypothetical protein C8R47DRAFT_1135470 [Mycena vitilis]|nr:hypothetical protein C8R47DRAFT_1158134 [Mycena vitilis]KAJ6480672.1 hypothetical protein C8R47DRAFT_1135470 [Mycena vitilis]